jgi:hypothetical protein
MLVHIGYHKAASTVLQDQLFGPAEGIFLPPAEPRHALVQRFVVPQPMCFDTAETRAHYDPIRRRAEAEGRVFVLSHERFSGYPPSGGFDSTIIADRLQRSFPEAQILIVLREQQASILSMYSQYVTDGGDLSLRDYLTPREPFLKRMPGFSPEFYRYHRLVDLYRRLFGAERVLCLVFEEFARDPAGSLARLYRFLGYDIDPPQTRTQNAKRPATFQVLQRQVNRRFSMNELSPGRGMPLANARRRFGGLSRHLGLRLTAGLDARLEARMKRLIENRFADNFGESNSALSEMMGINLGDYGYQMKAGDLDRTGAQR